MANTTGLPKDGSLASICPSKHLKGLRAGDISAMVKHYTAFATPDKVSTLPQSMWHAGVICS
ncbi:hypothetical protein FOXG_19976 [Fusarium oxysporum f. sp. lycopersici 4287]|uniref:Uncharacterized protein n=2 Tax=Fusarium oxysporum TaxID=5507 RepID=A0A0J9VA54_FUSO4|nr:hypothetical protein FOXG_19976 [Fusarium oxysporum f. sp. lycopersici 4287]EXK36927.1 hypothetical protein FOMG_07816 [Fusarium oxysporum f. sp. melonis 26406]KNB08013.1 hypothetical protein FOXG_19976 [Fusarium oxysporum f. sp. lycopersici 4287]